LILSKAEKHRLTENVVAGMADTELNI